MIDVDEFAKTIDRVLRRLVVRRRWSYQLSANGGDKDQMATGCSPGRMLLRRFDKIGDRVSNDVVGAFQIDFPSLPPTGGIRFTNLLPLIEITGIRIHHIDT